MTQLKREEIHYLTITQLRELYQIGEINPLEITNYMFDRINSIDDNLQSYATLMNDSALITAKSLSNLPKNLFGPLHGIPIGIKDLCYTKGIRTMGGTAVLENFIPGHDSTVVTRLQNAGAIILGKLNLTEGAMGGYNPVRQAPRNPWNKDVWAGSSSSGSGVATAAGLCFGSLGSDTGGSIRYPSASCGIVGLKPTYGRVSRYGVLALAESLDHVGPMTRSVKDAWDIFSVIEGYDRNDPTTQKNNNEMDPSEIDINSIRIGYDDSYASEGVNTEIVKAIRNVIKTFETSKLFIKDVQMPDVSDYLSYWTTLCTSEALYAHSTNYPSRKNEYGRWFSEWLDIGSSVTKEQYIEACNKREACNSLISNSLKDVDVLIAPCVIDLPHFVDESILYGPMNYSRNSLRQKFTVPFNYNRYPTLTIPCGMSESGLPIGFQIIGHPMKESLICALGMKFEELTNWSALHPNI